MSLIRILYDLRPWSIRSPVFHRLERFGFTPRELQALFQFPDFKIQRAITSEEVTPAKIDKNGFKVALDMKEFKPGEIKVKMVDNIVVVEGKFEKKDNEEGFVSREFLRKYILPKDIDVNKVESTLNSEGILTITAPPPPVNERIINVKQINDASETNKTEGKE